MATAEGRAPAGPSRSAPIATTPRLRRRSAPRRSASRGKASTPARRSPSRPSCTTATPSGHFAVARPRRLLGPGPLTKRCRDHRPADDGRVASAATTDAARRPTSRPVAPPARTLAPRWPARYRRGVIVSVPRRFNGPPDSANGGYTCGLVAELVDADVVQVTLRSPPPLETELAVERADAAGRAPARRDSRRPRTARRSDPGPARRRVTTRPPSAPRATGSIAGPRAIPSRPASSAGPSAGRATATASSRAGSATATCSPPTGRRTPRSPATTASCDPNASGAALDCPTSAPVANFGAGPAGRAGAAHGVDRAARARRAAARDGVLADRDRRPQAPRRRGPLRQGRRAARIGSRSWIQLRR